MVGLKEELKEDFWYLAIFLLLFGGIIFFSYSGYHFWKMLLHDNYEVSLMPVLHLCFLSTVIIAFLFCLMKPEADIKKELGIKWLE
jgi:hypothetical protein